MVYATVGSRGQREAIAKPLYANTVPTLLSLAFMPVIEHLRSITMQIMI